MFFVIWSLMAFGDCCGPGLVWFVSRKARNRRMHALFGNGPHGGRGTWQPVGPPSEARALTELRPVGLLRKEGWSVRTDIGDDYRLRVYDTRLEPRWLEGLLPDLGIGSEPANTYVLGGDFL